MTDGGALVAALPDSDGNVRMLIRPNRSLSPQGMLLLFVALATALLTIGVVFALFGAWLVLPFAGIEIAVLGTALYWLHRHLDDHEIVVVTQTHVRVRWRRGQRQSEAEFDRYWARVSLTPPAGTARRTRLRIGSHGRYVELGAQVREEDRRWLAGELATLLAR